MARLVWFPVNVQSAVPLARPAAVDLPIREHVLGEDIGPRQAAAVLPGHDGAARSVETMTGNT